MESEKCPVCGWGRPEKRANSRLKWWHCNACESDFSWYKDGLMIRFEIYEGDTLDPDNDDDALDP